MEQKSSPLLFTGKALVLIGAAALAGAAAIGYWYVMVAGAPQLDPPKAEQQTGLTFQVQSFPSPAMGEERHYGVVLPPGYAQHPKQRYPVVILLHGGHGNERDFEDKAKLTSVLHDLYQQRRLPSSIVVTPDGNDKRGSSPLWDPDYYNGPNGNVGNLVGSELVKLIKSRYRAYPQSQLWAIGGLSSGGWGAFNIGLRHPQFQVLFSHTGYFTDDSGPQNSPQSFIGQLSPQRRRQLRIYLDAGTTDHKYLAATKAFHTRLTDLNIANQFHIYPGGHGIVGQNVGWNYWHHHLTDSLSYVGRQFAMAIRSLPHSKTHSLSSPHPKKRHGKPQSTQTPSQADR